MLENVYNNMAPSYDHVYKDPEHIAEDQELFSYLNNKIHGTTLDIGSGTGLLLEEVEIHPLEYVGIDPSTEMINRSNAKFPDHTFFETGFDEAVISEKIDSIVSLYGSFSYVNPKSYHKVVDALSDNGFAFLMVYAPDYSPHYYTPEMTEAVHDNIDYAELNRLFPYSKLWQDKYVIVSNQPIELEDIKNENL